MIQMLVEAGADTNYNAGFTASRKKGPTKPLFAAIESGELLTTGHAFGHSSCPTLLSIALALALLDG